MESMTYKFNESMINSRIEAVDDPQLNRTLFAYYERLISPFADVEGLYQKIKNNKADIEKSADERKRIMGSSVKVALVSIAIAFVIVCVVLFGVFFTTEIDLILTMEGLLNLPEGDSFLWAFFFLWVPLISGIVIGIASLVLRMSFLIRYTNDCKKEIIRSKEELESKLPALKEVSCLIPPQYRYSEALRFFVEAYSNSKVDNLKEAVNLFDTHMYRKEMLESQQRIVQELQNINFNMSIISSQLDAIEFSIWRY